MARRGADSASNSRTARCDVKVTVRSNSQENGINASPGLADGENASDTRQISTGDRSIYRHIACSDY